MEEHLYTEFAHAWREYRDLRPTDTKYWTIEVETDNGIEDVDIDLWAILDEVF